MRTNVIPISQPKPSKVQPKACSHVVCGFERLEQNNPRTKRTTKIMAPPLMKAMASAEREWGVGVEDEDEVDGGGEEVVVEVMSVVGVTDDISRVVKGKS